MMMEKSNRVVPKMRFKEFEGLSEWQKYKLADYADFRRGAFPQPYGKSEWYDGSGSMPFVQVVDVGSNLKLVDKTKQKISVLAQPKSIFVRKNTVVVTLQGSIGRVAITQYDSYLDRTLLIFQSYKEKTDKRFWAYTIQQKFNTEKEKAPGGTIKTITKESLSNFEVFIPTYGEQQKIGHFFEIIDEMIQLQYSKVNKVKAIKAAYLSEMFPKEGEQYPKRRFKGFERVWNKVRLEEVFNQSGSGGTPRTTRQEYYGGDIPFLGISDITNSNGYIFNTEKTITIKGLNNSAAWIVPKESISLAMYASVGKVAILKIKGATSQAFYNMVIDNQSTRDYVYQYLVKMEAEKMWNRIISTGTQSNLNAEKVRNLIIPMPIDIVEQEKIGQFFKNLDTKISIEEEKLAKLEKLKQAYLNDMFV